MVSFLMFAFLFTYHFFWGHSLFVFADGVVLLFAVDLLDAFISGRGSGFPVQEARHLSVIEFLDMGLPQNKIIDTLACQDSPGRCQ